MKFKTADQRYLTARKSFAERSGRPELWSIVDHWPLYVGLGNLSRFLAIADLLRSTLGVPGHVAEFGTWRGANTLFLAKLLRVFDPHGAKVVHAFDSFEGLKEFRPQDAAAQELGGSYKGSLEELRAVIELHDMQDDVVIHQGVIEQTLPAALAQDEALSLSFVYCDTDLYASTLTILDNAHPRLAQGGVFVLDEWNHAGFPGETVAVREFIAKHGDAYSMQSVPGARQPSLVLRKLRG